MSLVVRILAPIGRDAELITLVLQQNGIPAEAISPLEFTEPTELDLTGPLLIAEEALTPTFVEQLGIRLARQPAWSDLPVLILTGAGRETRRSQRQAEERLALGSPVLLERPIRTATLVSSVRAALRARIKQYEIRDAVAALDAERETLRVLLNSLPVGVAMCNAAAEVVLTNSRLQAILRHPVHSAPDLQAFGQWPAFRPDGSRLQPEEHPLSQAMKTGLSVPPEDYIYERDDGTRGWISMAASPLHDAANAVTGGVVVVSDTDHQKRSDIALLQNEKLAAVGRLAASISHEINNPLEAVTNLLYLARQAPELSETSQGYLTDADQELKRVAQIVSHTLRFHRQSSRPRAISAQELLEPTLGIFTGRLANSGITLSSEHRGSALVTCFEGEIRQVLNNLVGNALDSMRNGGTLRIRTSQSRSWKSGLPGVRITIADTGHGMSPSVTNRIFDAFYTTKGINGTGLGLWIAKGIVEKHHGSLALRTSAKEFRSGTVFSLFLPYDPLVTP